jgi:hypothetical protein
MKYKFIFIFFFGLVSVGSLAETNFVPKQDLFDILYGKQFVHVTLKVDLDALLRSRFSDDEIAGLFHYQQVGGKGLNLSVKISLRGKFRRRLCGFPPLKLNFLKSELSEHQLSNADEYKLVTHCLEGEEGDVNIIKEYLAYQCYRVISPLSYKAKLLKITYQDTKSDDKIVGMAILLEDKSSFEKRTNMKELKDSFSINRLHFEDTNFKTHALFQYMIGNLDWSTAIVKNLDIYKSKEADKLFIVPYDFDFSGFVNVAYAVPNKDYQQKKVSDRLLLEPEENDLSYSDEIKKFTALKSEFIALIRKQKGINMDIKNDLEQYLLSFYSELDRGLTRSFH